MKNYLLIICSMMLIALSSCKKSFLESTPMQDIAVDKAIINIEGARAALTGLYGTMQSAGYYGRTLPVIADLMSDNIYISARNSNRYQPQDQYNITVSDSYASGLWNNLYAIIANANILIKRCGEIEFPTGNVAEANHILGEAYALRALVYHDLTRLFAMPYRYSANGAHTGVPVVTSGDYSVVISPARNTVNECYDQMINDLKKSISLLPETPVGFSLSSNKGRVTLFGAKAILSRVYLYKGDWANAEAIATEVITANKYTLLANGVYVTDSRKLNNTETIFEVQYAATDNLGSDALVNFCKQGGSYGDALATNDLYNQYAATDARRGHLLMGRRTGSGGENPAVQITKFDDNSSFAEGIKVMRLSELYLTRAEARAKQGGKDNLAIADLDLIRKRADAGAATTTATGTELQDLILTERRKELFLEGHRLFDLTRNNKSFTKYRTAGITINITNLSLKTILPIPQSEMSNNKNMVQNEGYK